jgi:hypothetical protein
MPKNNKNIPAPQHLALIPLSFTVQVAAQLKFMEKLQLCLKAKKPLSFLTGFFVWWEILGSNQ